MHLPNNEYSFPIRIVCPDVLSDPKHGDLIHGQIAAFALGPVNLVKEQDNLDFKISAANDLCLDIVGRVAWYNEQNFEFEGVSCEYWNVELETNIGRITVVINKTNANFEMKNDIFISANIVLSFDVAIRHIAFCDKPFDEEYERGFSFELTNEYNYTFTPNLKNAKRVLSKCIKKGEYKRFVRTCAKTIKFVDESNELTIDNIKINEAIKSVLSSDKYDCVLKQIIEGENTYYLGQEVIAVASNGKTCFLVFIGVDSLGFVNELHLLNPQNFKLGCDNELYAISMLYNGLEHKSYNALREILAEKCIYRSEYADKTVFGAKQIIDRFNFVDSNLKGDDYYSHEISRTRDLVKQNIVLPPIYDGVWCVLEYRKTELVGIFFAQISETGLITKFILSRDNKYLTTFFAGDNPKQLPIVNVKSILERKYGIDDTVSNMRRDDSTNVDDDEVYVWREADKYARGLLQDNGYTILCIEIEEDCIGYKCKKQDENFAIYIYSYGKERQVYLDGDYCQRLKKNDISKDSTIIIVYLHTTVVTDENGDVSFKVCSYGDTEYIEFWMLGKIGEKNAFISYPKDMLFKLVPRLITHYNDMDLDGLKAISKNDIVLDTIKHGTYYNVGVWGHLSYLMREYGKMKMAYLRTNDVVYSRVPYIENYCYITFSTSNDTDEIEGISEHPLNWEDFNELIITDEDNDYIHMYKSPLIEKIVFVTDQECTNFSAMINFDNGEIRKYDFPLSTQGHEGQINNIDGEFAIVEIDGIAFTKKIFNNGVVVDHLEMPSSPLDYEFRQRGQGVKFANGYSISSSELYYKSHNEL